MPSATIIHQSSLPPHPAVYTESDGTRSALTRDRNMGDGGSSGRPVDAVCSAEKATLPLSLHAANDIASMWERRYREERALRQRLEDDIARMKKEIERLRRRNEKISIGSLSPPQDKKDSLLACGSTVTANKGPPPPPATVPRDPVRVRCGLLKSNKRPALEQDCHCQRTKTCLFPPPTRSEHDGDSNGADMGVKPALFSTDDSLSSSGDNFPTPSSFPPIMADKSASHMSHAAIGNSGMTPDQRDAIFAVGAKISDLVFAKGSDIIAFQQKQPHQKQHHHHQRQRRNQHQQKIENEEEEREGDAFEAPGVPIAPTKAPPMSNVAAVAMSATEEKNWYEHFRQLQAFQAKTGHTNPNLGSTLYKWSQIQRLKRRKQERTAGGGSAVPKLTQDMIAALDSIGFQWCQAASSAQARAAAADQNWQLQFEKLKRFREKYGHCDLNLGPQSRKRSHQKLRRWISSVRSAYQRWKAGDETTSLSQERREALEELGFIWDATPQTALEARARWLGRFSELEMFKAIYGHVRVLYRDSKDLYSWTKTQRTQYRKLAKGEQTNFTVEYRDALEGIGFEWDISVGASASVGDRNDTEAAWRRQFECLKRFHALYGHFNVPSALSGLKSWLLEQRTYYKSLKRGEGSKLTDKQVKALDGLDSLWLSHFASQQLDADAVWERNFAALKGYRDMHGNTDVPKGTPLASWLSTQRANHRRREAGESTTLTDTRKAALDGLGLVWNPLTHVQRIWIENFEKLCKFKAEHGHIDVPTDAPHLYNWTVKQRQLFRQAERGTRVTQSPEQRAKLIKIGFDFHRKVMSRAESDRHIAWNRHLEDLRAFKAVYGHLDVPQQSNGKGSNTLYNWVLYQRKEYRKWERGESNYPHERRAALEELGFVWKPDKV